jgi:hypothetical protein
VPLKRRSIFTRHPKHRNKTLVNITQGDQTPFLREVSRFPTRKNGTPNSPIFQQCCFFITDTDFSLWHACRSWSLDAQNENNLPTLINHCMYYCPIYFDL